MKLGISSKSTTVMSNVARDRSLLARNAPKIACNWGRPHTTLGRAHSAPPDSLQPLKGRGREGKERRRKARLREWGREIGLKLGVREGRGIRGKGKRRSGKKEKEGREGEHRHFIFRFFTTGKEY
jgi:hypothetical protein